MSTDKDFEIVKLLLGVTGGLIAFIGSLMVGSLNNIKKTNDKIFERLNRTDAKLTEQIAKCTERHRR